MRKAAPFAALALIAACSRFSDGVTTSPLPSDAGAIDAAPRTDAATRTDAAIASGSFCTQHTDALLCDDFERDPITPGGGWDDFENAPAHSGNAVIDANAPEGEGRAFHVTIHPSDLAANEPSQYTDLHKDLTTTFFDGRSHIELSFRLYILYADVDYAKIGSIIWSSDQPGGDKVYRATGIAIADDLNADVISADNDMVKTPPVGEAPSATGRWYDVKFVLDRVVPPTPASMFHRTVTMGTTPIVDDTVTFDPKGTDCVLRLGLFDATRRASEDYGDGPGRAIMEAWFDDVLLEAK